MNPPFQLDSSQRTPALPGFGVLGWPLEADSTASNFAARSASASCAGVGQPSFSRAWRPSNRPIERVQLEKAARRCGQNSGLLARPIERVQLGCRPDSHRSTNNGGSLMPPTK
jgi:hypothetical protein